MKRPTSSRTQSSRASSSRVQPRRGKPAVAAGPSQRQLRAGELVRHALVEILRESEAADPALAGVSVTLTQVRMSPDLRHAICYVEPLGAGLAGTGGPDVKAVIEGLNRAARLFRGQLGRQIDLRFTPDLRFVHDESFAESARLDRLFRDPRVQADLAPPPETPLADPPADEA